jgi:hypothetical protein
VQQMMGHLLLLLLLLVYVVLYSWNRALLVLC